MKRKTSITLSDESLDSIKRIAASEDRSVSYVLEQFINASAQVAEDATKYGASVKQIADKIKASGGKVRGGKGK